MSSGIFQAIGWAFLPFVAWPLVHLVAGRKAGVLSFSEGLITVIDEITFFIGEATKWLLPILVLSVAASVFALSIFGVTTTKWLESAKYLQALVIMLGAGATLLASQHVRVDIFHTTMTDIGKARVDLLGYYLLMVPVCILLVWNAQSFVAFAWAIREGSSEATGIRGVYLLKTLIPVFAITMMAQGLAIATRAAMCLSHQDRPLRPPRIPPFFRSPGEKTR
jgi:TRAP-type mannitol/chloroaromatic compound transport system permease small subunit